MTDVLQWDGTAWRSLRWWKNEQFKWWSGTEWLPYSPFRPQNVGWLNTVGAVFRHEQSSLRAPVHMWVGDHWWPPEAVAAKSTIVAQHDGSWVVTLGSIYENPAGEAQPPDSPVPPITAQLPLKAGGVKRVPMTPDANITVSRTWHGYGGFNTIITLAAGWVTYVSGVLDFTRPVLFGADGDQPWGPTQYLAYAPVVHAPAIHGTKPPVVHAPSRPTGLRVTSVAQYTINLAWTPVAGVIWELTRDGRVVATVDKPGYVDHVPHANTDYHYQLRAVNSGGKSPVVTVTGHSLPVPVHVTPPVVHHPVAHTVVMPMVWDAAYDQNHHRRSDHASNPWQDHLVMGRYDSTHGNTYSVIKYKMLGKIPHGAHITSVVIKAYAEHWFLNSGGTAVLRTTKLGAHAPPNVHPPATTGHKTNMTWTHKTGWKHIALPTDQGWATGGINAIQFGPPHSTAQSGYGVLAAKGANKPVLTITYTI